MQVEAQQAAQDEPTLGEVFEKVGKESREQVFTTEEYVPAFQNVVTLTGTVSTELDLLELQSGDEIVKCMLRVRRPSTSMVDSCAPPHMDDFTGHCPGKYIEQLRLVLSQAT